MTIPNLDFMYRSILSGSDPEEIAALVGVKIKRCQK